MGTPLPTGWVVFSYYALVGAFIFLGALKQKAGDSSVENPTEIFKITPSYLDFN